MDLLLGLALRALLVRTLGSPRFAAQVAPRLPTLSAVVMLALVFTAVSLKADMLRDPTLLLSLLPALLLFYAAVFALGLLVGRRFPRGDGIAMVYSTAVRKVSLALALALTTFGEDGVIAAVALAVALLLQVQLAAASLRVVGWVFGPAEARDESGLERAGPTLAAG